MTLTDFLLARIAEDEYDAKTRSLGRGWRKQWLAECEAKRRIVEEWRTAQAEADGGDMSGRIAAFAFTLALQHLALPYADHPDYREEWRP